jgi:hypothetical protein
MAKAKRCIDCGAELTPDVKSRHQPTLRCLECFDSFRESVSVKLAYWADGGLGDPPGGGPVELKT